MNLMLKLLKSIALIRILLLLSPKASVWSLLNAFSWLDLHLFLRCQLMSDAAHGNACFNTKEKAALHLWIKEAKCLR